MTYRILYKGNNCDWKLDDGAFKDLNEARDQRAKYIKAGYKDSNVLIITIVEETNEENKC